MKKYIRFMILSAFLLAALLPRTAMAADGVNGILEKDKSGVITAKLEIPDGAKEEITTIHAHVSVEAVRENSGMQEPNFTFDKTLDSMYKSGELLVKNGEVIRKGDDRYIIDIILSGTGDLVKENDTIVLGTVKADSDMADVGFVSALHESEDASREPCVQYIFKGGKEIMSPTMNVTVTAREEEKPTPTAKPTATPKPTPAPDTKSLKLDSKQKKELKHRTTGNKAYTLKITKKKGVGKLTYTYKSSNKSVVKVLKSGKLRFMGVGKATVTVTGKNKKGKVYVLKVKVIVEKPGKPTVTLSRKNKKKKTFTVSTSTVRGATGFQVQFSKKDLKKTKEGSHKRRYKAGNKMKNQAVKVKKGKTSYYVRVRAYQDVDGERIFGSWSSVKTVRSR